MAIIITETAVLKKRICCPCKKNTLKVLGKELVPHRDVLTLNQTKEPNLGVFIKDQIVLVNQEKQGFPIDGIRRINVTVKIRNRGRTYPKIHVIIHQRRIPHECTWCIRKTNPAVSILTYTTDDVIPRGLLNENTIETIPSTPIIQQLITIRGLIQRDTIGVIMTQTILYDIVF